MCNEFRFFTLLRCVQNDRINLLFRSETLGGSNVNRTYCALTLTLSHRERG